MEHPATCASKNRVSRFAVLIADFCNKICHELPWAATRHDLCMRTGCSADATEFLQGQCCSGLALTAQKEGDDSVARTRGARLTTYMTAAPPHNVFKSISMPVATRAVTQSASMFSQALRRTSSPTHS